MGYCSCILSTEVIALAISFAMRVSSFGSIIAGGMYMIWCFSESWLLLELVFPGQVYVCLRSCNSTKRFHLQKTSELQQVDNLSNQSSASLLKPTFKSGYFGLTSGSKFIWVTTRVFLLHHKLMLQGKQFLAEVLTVGSIIPDVGSEPGIRLCFPASMMAR